MRPFGFIEISEAEVSARRCASRRDHSRTAAPSVARCLQLARKSMRAIFFVVLISLAPAAYAVDGFNLPGSDYANFTADSALVCRQTCAGDSKCKAYTWVKPGYQGPSGRCWLKTRVPSLVKDSCCDSGSAQNILATQLRPENNTNRPGWDIKNFDLSSYQACQDSCAQEASCTAWTWVRPGQGKIGHCWLKRQAPFPVADNCCISGVKLRPRSVRID
jgi:hypothetical protein